MTGELPPSGKRTVVTSVHWRCERCGGARYVLVERGDERLSWCARCFDENVDRRATQEAPVTILDLEKHRETCTRCRPRSLCREGARILEAATQALAEIAAPMPSRKMGKA